MPKNPPPRFTEPTKKDIAWIIRKLRGLRFGRLEITVFDGRIVEITRVQQERRSTSAKDPEE